LCPFSMLGCNKFNNKNINLTKLKVLVEISKIK
jgi:hypothetical protein